MAERIIPLQQGAKEILENVSPGCITTIKASELPKEVNVEKLKQWANLLNSQNGVTYSISAQPQREGRPKSYRIQAKKKQ